MQDSVFLKVKQMEHTKDLKILECMNKESGYAFSDYFDIQELQKIQNLFSEATGVASLITEPDGTPITEPSGFCGLCNEIRKTEKGFIHCKKSDSIIGKTNEKGPNVHRCYSGGLLDAGASIIVEGKHIANWLIGQIIDEDQPLESLQAYAREIELNEEIFKREISNVKRMSKSQFESSSNFLYENAQMISRYAMNNIKISRELDQKNRHETEIEKLNAELEEKNKEINRFFEVSSDLFSITDIRGNFYSHNRAWGGILGYTEEDLKTMHYQDYLHPDDLYDYYQVMKQIEETGKNVGFTSRFRHKNGSCRYLEWSCIKEGRYYYSAGRDITQRKVAEEALISSDSRLHRAQEIAHIGNWELDLANSQIWASDESFRIYGLEKKFEYLPLKTARQVVAEEDRPMVADALASLINGSAGYNVDYMIVRAEDGRKRILNSQAAIEYDSDGKPTKVLGVIQDITEKKQAEQILRESEERFRVIFAQSPFGIALVDSISHRISQANKRFLEIIGRTVEELNGLNWMDITHPDDLENDIKLWEVFHKGEISSYSINKRYLLADSSYVWTNLTISKVEVENCESQMHIIMLEDITQSKMAEEEILYYSYHDQMTGVYNRRFYEEEIKKLDKEESLPLSIIEGGVNGLKLFNDAFGHSQGDLLLKRVAEIIRSACRPNDIVLRWGGDEFVILLPGMDGEETALLADRIKVDCAKEVIHDIHISISLGWDVKKDRDQTISEIIKSAEDRMYKNKVVESEGLRGSIIKTMLHTLHAKNSREEKHSRRVSSISQSIGKALQLPVLELNKLKAVGLLHDIGKIGVEDSILDKVDALTQKEFDEIKKHPDIGYRILNSSTDMKELAEITLSHHERWDGKGYPKGLRGAEIPVLSRIISIADSYDAMTSDRPYRKALTKGETVRQIFENSGTQFDEQIAKVFIEVVVPGL
jgi:diguanylate cyclase (GGDEF)-like protein/PAS domain S-box-containing protein